MLSIRCSWFKTHHLEIEKKGDESLGSRGDAGAKGQVPGPDIGRKEAESGRRKGARDEPGARPCQEC